MLRFDVKSGPTGSLFGSVTPTDIADELWRTRKIRVDRRKIGIDVIKRIGRYSVPIQVFEDVTVEVKTLVVPEGGELPPEEELAALEAAEAAEAAERRGRPGGGRSRRRGAGGRACRSRRGGARPRRPPDADEAAEPSRRPPQRPTARREERRAPRASQTRSNMSTRLSTGLWRAVCTSRS